jgi:hypothetical protein
MKRIFAAAGAALALASAMPAFATDFILSANNANPSHQNFRYSTVLSTPTHVETTILVEHGPGSTSDSFFFGVKPFNFLGAGSGTSNTASLLRFNGPIEVYSYVSNGVIDAALDAAFISANYAAELATIRGFADSNVATLLVSGNGNPVQQLFSGVPLTPGLLYEIRVPTTGSGSYVGTLTADAVPEPATWAMMLVGFGLIGFAMRRQGKSQPKVRFAF